MTTNRLHFRFSAARLQRYVAVLLFSLFAAAPLGAVEDVRFRNITMEDGLHSNTVRNIVQDRYGFIWMGSDNGLSRYDGHEIRSFHILDNGLDQYVSALLAVSDGLYVGTSQGVWFFDFRTESFQRIVSQLNATVFSFAADRDSNIWIAAQGGIVSCYHPSTQQSQQYVIKGWENLQPGIFVDANNQVWLFCGRQSEMLMRFNKATSQFQLVPLQNAPADMGCYAMTQTHDGRLWMGTWSSGLLLLDESGRLETVLPVVSGVGNHIHALYEISPDRLLICCDAGLVDLNPHDRTWRLIADPDDMGSINNRFVYSAISDTEGGLWFSTFYGGVNYVSPVSERFTSFQNHAGQHGLQGNVISRFCEDARGRIWIASDDGGLNCLQGRNSDEFIDFPARQQFSHLNIHALCIDGDELWIGTYAGGIYRMNVNNGQTVHYGNAQGLTGNSCYSLFRDSSGRIWAGTMNDLCLFDASAGQFRLVKHIGALVIDIDEDAAGHLWLSTQGAGLWRCDRTAKNWHKYNPLAQVNNVCIASDKRVWVAMQSGLHYYDASADSLVTVKLDLPVSDINCIVEDADFLWLSTTKGLVRYDMHRDILIFNRYDGLVCEQFQPNSGLKASDGRIFFGGARGFNAFYPYQIKVNTLPPAIFITGLHVYNQYIPVGDKRLPESLSHLKKLDLSYGDDFFTLSFAALSYCSPEKNQYAYMLEGFDKDWIYCGNRHEATYTNIPSGTYTFRVKATNNDGFWSEQEATLRIVVHPPFWLAWWAKLLYAILIVAAVWLLLQYRLRKAERRHQEEMQRLNEQAAAEVRDARLRFFTMIAHEIRTPVSLIIGPLETLKQNAAQFTANGTAQNWNGALRILDRNAQRLLSLVNQLLDFSKVQQEGMQMHFTLQNIANIMQSVAERFEPTLHKKGIQFSVKYPAADFVAMVDGEGLTKVISNLMTNASKYTKSSVSLLCHVAADGKQFSIVVEDDGIGISEADQEIIFNAFYQARDNKPGTGIGLSIVKTIVDQHHGEVGVRSQVGQGSRFIVTLPVEQEVVDSPASPSARDVPPAVAPVAPATTQVEDKDDTTPSVLIVEDDADMLSFLSSHFARHYTVFTATNGHEGLSMLRTHAVSLIVSDWMMPEMDGAEFCQRVRADRDTSHIPLIMLTAKTDDESKAQSMELGADVFIEKPFSMKYLDACIRNLIERRRNLMRRFSEHPEEGIEPLAGNSIDNEFLVRMNQIIEENLGNADLSVNFLAEQLNISRSGLFSKIKALTDVTPNEMIQVVRLKRAAQLLAEGQYRVNEVCYMVGFSSPSYFTKCFQKQFGKKPGEMMKS